MPFICSLLLLPFLFLTQGAEHRWKADPDVSKCSGTSIFGPLSEAYARFEPSDSTYDAHRKLLFVASDSGDVAAVEFNGAINQTWRIVDIADNDHLDLEGISMIPSRPDFIYLGVEHPAMILEFSLTSNKTTRQWDIDAEFSIIQTSLRGKRKPNSGLESLVWFPSDGKDPESELFLVGDQLTGSILVFSVPIYSFKNTSPTLISSFSPPGQLEDLSAMQIYKNELWLLFDKPRFLVSTPIDALNALIRPKVPLMPINASTIQPLKSTTDTTVLHFSTKDHKGHESLSFVEIDGFNTYVFLGIDQAKKKGDRKDLVRWEYANFRECFLSNTDTLSHYKSRENDDEL